MVNLLMHLILFPVKYIQKAKCYTVNRTFKNSNMIDDVNLYDINSK